jgi:hypothetical protein
MVGRREWAFRIRDQPRHLMPWFSFSNSAGLLAYVTRTFEDRPIGWNLSAR